ncbi:hypothetical protein NEOLEDRAFT_1147814 [Neolentinus lepideus HHB14362 ss-1]|uniref:Domain of unknown function at the cortex 1 domain-containing protein n=1 Tax=Neolentinus lepideus HHB14362 ss-1 TaxID=1314782 RepID=A0A165SWI5_9AGAM|nr:hypothetical protein NEOLEDRAFT_1147814 [Neolentinus lepideus HHB14362 ss-1]
MSPRLRVLAGPSLSALEPIEVNSDKPVEIASDAFQGKIIAYIKDFTNAEGKVLEHEYFQRQERKGVSWSIQVQGRFVEPQSADDILFGNAFDHSLNLPWGSGAALKLMKPVPTEGSDWAPVDPFAWDSAFCLLIAADLFARYVDPTLEHDLTSQTQPWALSPLISTMPFLAHTRDSPPPFPSSIPIADDTSQLTMAAAIASYSSDGSASSTSSLSSIRSMASKASKKSNKRGKKGNQDMFFANANERRSHFTQADRRKQIAFGPEDIITTDFCYGYLEFSPSLALKLPGGISIDLMRYWDGQQVRFICCKRRKADDPDGEDGMPWGQMFWCVAIELVKTEQGQANGSVSQEAD